MVCGAGWNPVEVFHVGSTSVEGMIAKPIIDILICPDDEVEPEDVAMELESFEYKNFGECGRPGRIFLSSGDQQDETFYVHVCHKEHPVAQDQLLFRELMRTNPVIFEGYYHLKLMLAEAFREDRTLYRKAKGTYVESVLSAYRMRDMVDVN